MRWKNSPGRSRPTRRLLQRGPRNAAGSRAALCEGMEPRQLLTVIDIAPGLQSFVAHPDNPAADTIDLSTKLFDTDVPGTVAEFRTSQGAVQIALADQAAPQTVANFLKYVDSGAYNGTILHRSVVFGPEGVLRPTAQTPADIVQGGGYYLNALATHVAFDARVPSEFAGTPNGVGTIAMALSGDPNSGNTEWFVNLSDNSAGLDLQQFTVFGNVVRGLGVLNDIAKFPTKDISAQFNNTALTDTPLANKPDLLASTNLADLITVNQAFSFPGIDLMQFSAASTQPDLIRPIVTGHTLSFQYSRGRSGTAQISFNAVGVDGIPRNRIFTITIPDLAAGNTAGPVAVNDAPSIARTGAVAIFRPTDNDTDALATLLVGSVTITTPPVHGIASLRVDNGMISYTPDPGYTGPDSFQYTVADTLGNVSAPGTVTLRVSGPSVTATVGTAARRSLTYTEPDGTVTRIGVIGGVATITFAGSEVTLNTVRGFGTATGGDATITDITIVANVTGGTPSLFVLARGGSDGVATLGTINGPALAAIIAPAVEIIGEMKVAGLGQMLVGTTRDCQLNIGPVLTTRLLSINNAINTNVVSLTGLGIIRSRHWVSNTGFEYTISAADISSLLITGEFANSIKLTGTGSGLRAGRIGGRVSQGTWTIAGTVGALSLLGGVDPSWRMDTQNLIQAMLVRGNFSSTITCGAIGSMLITGNLTNANLFTGANYQRGFIGLQRLVVGGSITNSIIRGNGNLGVISAAGISGSGIFAAMNSSLDPAVLPTTLEPFANFGNITAVRVRNFSDTRISAYSVGTLSLGTITAANSGKKHGLAVVKVTAVVGTLQGGAKLLLLGRLQLKTATTFADHVTAKGLVLQDFTINIIPPPPPPPSTTT